jgi:hypothetical protein
LCSTGWTTGAEQAPRDNANAQVLDIASVSGIGIKTADMLTHEVFSRALRDPHQFAGREW